MSGPVDWLFDTEYIRVYFDVNLEKEKEKKKLEGQEQG
jgi:hypothetical protein